jgi:hypothetical protein
MQQQSGYRDKLQPINNINFPGINLITFQLVHRLVNYQINKNDYKAKYFFFFTIVKGVGNKNSRTYDFRQKINIKFNTRELAMLSFVFKQLAIGNINVLPYDKFARTKHVNIWQPPSKQSNTNYAKTMSYSLAVSDKSHNNTVKYTMALNIHEMYALSIELDLLINKAFTLDFKEQSLAQVNKDTSIPENQNNINTHQNYNNVVNPKPIVANQSNMIYNQQPSSLDYNTESVTQNQQYDNNMNAVNGIKTDFNHVLNNFKGNI